MGIGFWIISTILTLFIVIEILLVVALIIVIPMMIYYIVKKIIKYIQYRKKLREYKKTDKNIKKALEE